MYQNAKTQYNIFLEVLEKTGMEQALCKFEQTFSSRVNVKTFRRVSIGVFATALAFHLEKT